ncbi:MAG: monovalent cation/H+ antiporter subunit D family protein [Gemmatimonadota bacterium]|nr:monovalent cation/H+ antiporter subunit D family protein [Gemmatimonadota bacterium]MDH5759927.1 monovalent cation/H+ antiporter subunit D family protein [Gemmatimonadota bacterium]
MSAHLPVLLIVVPLLAAPLAALVRHPRGSWVVALGASWWALGVSIALLMRVLADGTISYEIGGWAAPWGIEYRIDVANAFVLLIVSGIGAVVTPYARVSVEREVEAARIPLFHTAFILCLTGLLGIAVTGDVFNVFVFLEISSLSAYALIALGQDRRALTSAYQYLVMGSVGATFIVIGIGLLYVMTGTLNMADLAVRLPEVAATRTIPVAFAFLTVGICLKLALFPLHLWLPNAYTFAPSSVTAFIASTATKVAVYMLLRFFFTVFGAAFSFDVMQLDMVLMPLALVAIVSMSLVAIYQQNAKRLLAYSSLAQIGYMILGISLASVTGVTAGILHLFNHALMKGALFMTLGCVMYRVGSVRVEAMAGLGKTMPWTMAAFVIGGLSLIGVPLTVGFVSKWYLVLAALEQGLWPLAVVVLLGSLLAVMYVWKVVEVAYFQPPPDGDPPAEAPLSLLVPTWALVVANLYFGIDAKLTAGVAMRAAEALLGVGQ